MADLSLEFEWESPGGLKGPELRATWARVEIRVGDENITQVEDRASRGIRKGIYVPLYPLAEWIAANWWALLSEVSSPDRENNGYSRRHEMQSASEGYALPSLRMEPEGRNVRLLWRAYAPPLRRVRFLSSGEDQIDRDSFQETLRGFIQQVVNRLRDEGVEETFLEQEWAAIENATSEEDEFCSAAGMLGRDPYALSDHETKAILSCASGLSPSFLMEFFASTNIAGILGHVHLIRSVFERAAQASVHLRSMDELLEKAPRLDSSLQPWQQGYQFADSLRNRIEANSARISSCYFHENRYIHEFVNSYFP